MTKPQRECPRLKKKQVLFAGRNGFEAQGFFYTRLTMDAFR